jgi:hypothetical protein
MKKNYTTNDLTILLIILSTLEPIDIKLYMRIEGIGEGVWRIRERRNTVPENVYVLDLCIGKGI